MSYIIKYARKFLAKIESYPKGIPEGATIGKNVVFGRNVVIKAKKIIIGDGTKIGDNVRIYCDEFIIGDYGVIYHDCFFPGPGKILIGNNFWMGNGALIDAMGNPKIGNNVCLASSSQIWTHMIFGDMSNGCRFNSIKQVNIGDDVWIGPQCTISPVDIKENSVVMMGALVTKNIANNRVFGGNPAVDLTDKIGSQFKEVDESFRRDYLLKMLDEFSHKYNLKWNEYITLTHQDKFNHNEDKMQIDILNRTYLKRWQKIEFKLMPFLLPEIKLNPANTPIKNKIS